MEKKRIAFVVQRYGLAINGGSELLCRQIAERLLPHYDVTVLTSCAEDHMTWANAYEPGLEDINGVHVHRFPVENERTTTRGPAAVASFNDLGDFERSFAWQCEQGPRCMGLLRHLLDHKQEYDAIIFMTYLYYTTCFGIQAAPEKSLLLPTAHDELPLYQPIFYSVFNLPKYFIYNTQTEKDIVNNRFHNGHIPGCIAGAGIDIDEATPTIDLAARFGVSGDYMLYVGRIDLAKGMPELFDWFTRFRTETGRDIKLVLAGKSTIDIPGDDSIVHVGFVDDEEKINLYRGARCMVLHSPFESLSMSTLESMYLETPVLLNGNCAVLKTHIENSGAGYYYHSYEQFAQGAAALLDNPGLNRKMGKKGRKYVRANYRWDVIIKRIREGIEYVAGL